VFIQTMQMLRQYLNSTGVQILTFGKRSFSLNTLTATSAVWEASLATRSGGAAVKRDCNSAGDIKADILKCLVFQVEREVELLAAVVIGATFDC
jgi:hypothetical protein